MSEIMILDTFEKTLKFQKSADFFTSFLQKSCYLWLPKTCYLTSYLRVEVTRGNMKKKHALGWGGGGLVLVSLEVQKSLSKNVLSFKVNHPKHVLTRV